MAERFRYRPGCYVGCGMGSVDGERWHIPKCEHYPWHEYVGQELPDDTPVRINGKDEGSTVGDYRELRFPGDYPFLKGLAALMQVEVKAGG